jgi:hypothetical protein
VVWDEGHAEERMADDLVGNGAVVFVNQQRADQVLEVGRDIVCAFCDIRPSVLAVLQLLVDVFAFWGVKGCFADSEGVSGEMLA